VSRVVAICKGGPLDGLAFSVEEGAAIGGADENPRGHYLSTGATGEIPADLVDQFGWADHSMAVVYREAVGG
jgi:hypothetical protein